MQIKKGFTLIELIVVISIMMMIAVITIPNTVAASNRAAHLAIVDDLFMLRNAAHSNRVKYLTTGVIKWSDLTTLKNEGELSAYWSGTTPYGDPYTLLGFDPNASMLTARVDVKSEWRDFVLRRVSNSRKDPNTTTGILMDITEPGSIPAMRTKVSLYPGAPADERRMFEQIEMLKGYISRAESLITTLRDLNDPNYYINMTGTTHLRKLIVDELVSANPVINNNNINVDTITTNNIRFVNGVGDKLAIGDLNINTLTVNNLKVLQNADIRLGGWAGIHDGRLNGITLYATGYESGYINARNTNDLMITNIGGGMGTQRFALLAYRGIKS